MKYRKNHKSPIVPEGLPYIIPAGAVTIVTFSFGDLWMALPMSVVTAFVIWFFRNPNRKISEDNRVVVSPADGKVITIENVTENDLLKCPCKKISIFMSLFNVHVNRVPYSGMVSNIRYEKGKFLAANLSKASFLNEKNSVLFKTDEGKEILTVQVAGIIARRIVCWLKEGMHVQKGERFGLIQFGSRLEVFLPFDTTVCLRMGDKVKAGETPMGYLT